MSFPPPEPSKLHAWFKARPGSDHIASLFALEGLAFWASRQMWRHRGQHLFSSCDVGSGIGTTLACLASWVGDQIVSVEDQSWCQDQVRHNLAFSPCDILYYDKIPSYMSFDFVVLDGPQIHPSDWGCLAPGATVFVEGGRRDQRATLLRVLRASQRPYCVASWRPHDRSKGYSVVRVDPSRWERVWFAYVRCREWWWDWLARRHGVAVGKRRG